MKPAINMRIPRREDINIHDSLDERAACKHFLGKSLQDAELMFSGDAFYYQEDFIYMGPVANGTVAGRIYPPRNKLRLVAVIPTVDCDRKDVYRVSPFLKDS